VDKGDFKKIGYSQEEEYFYKQNKELIERNREKASQEKAIDDRPDSWMKCPKCGGQMEEIDLAGIDIDKCQGCQGIYFDNGELDILLQSRDRGGFLGLLKKFVK
jgi:hypothetical protein